MKKDFTIFSARGRKYDRSFSKTVVMAIVNASPDSFSGDGKKEKTQQYIQNILDSGAEIIDIGGQSTGPNSLEVSANEEIDRIIDVIENIRKLDKNIPISIDTQKAYVASVALDSGADFINDISAFSDGALPKLIVDHDCSIVLMRNKSLRPDFLIQDCRDQLSDIVNTAKSLSIKDNQIILDPGLGFGDLANKDYDSLPGADSQANMELVKSISEYSLGLPVLIGGSRKRFIGSITGEDDPAKRLGGSIALAIISAQNGASIVRVHDPKDTRQALMVM